MHIHLICTQVRPHEADTEGSEQDTVCLLHEPDGRLVHHQLSPAAPLQRVRHLVPGPGRAAAHLQQHPVAAPAAGRLPHADAQVLPLARAGRPRSALTGHRHLPAHRHQVPLHIQPQGSLQHLPGIYSQYNCS